MTPIFKTIFALMMVLGLAACGTSPLPFKGAQKVTADEATLDIPSAVGIAIVPVQDMPEPLNTQLRTAVAKGLEPYEIPAEAVPQNTGLGFTLEGRVIDRSVEEGTITADILWVLRSRTGREAGVYMQAMAVTEQQWTLGALATAGQAGRDAAAAMAQVIDSDTQRAGGGSVLPRPQTQAEAPPPLRISVKPIEGAPGDGREALQLATLEMLMANGVKRDDINPDVVLMGQVDTEASVPGQEYITITWRAITQDGEELGDVSLSNNIPKGSLDGRWGSTAFAIAQAGLPQLLELLSFAPRF